MLWLWLVSGLVGSCLCSGVYLAGSPDGIYPGGRLVSSEAHGPLARQALLPGGFPFFRHHYPTALVATRRPEGANNLAVSGSAGTPLITRRLEGAYDPPVLESVVTPPAPHLLSASGDFRRSDQVIQPAPEAAAVSKPKHTVAVVKVRRPVFKNCHDIENNVEAHSSIHSGLAAEDSLGKLVAVSRYHPALTHAVNLPFVTYYYPFQVPAQAYPPAFFQPPQSVQVPQQTPVYPQQPPVYPQRPVSPPRPPQYPQYPQQPVYGPPPQQTPVSPPAPQRPAEEFDDSDTVVIDNPDFERSAGRGQPKPAAEPDVKSFRGGGKPCDEEGENAKRVVDEFQNRQLLRLLKQNQPVSEVLPTPIQTPRGLEEVGRPQAGAEGEKSSEDYFDGGAQNTQYFPPASTRQGKT